MREGVRKRKIHKEIMREGVRKITIKKERMRERGS
jgi:hypothetical protein